MDLFEPVEIDDIPANQGGANGRVSFPLVKAFMDSGLASAKLNREMIDENRTIKSLRGNIRYYVRQHKLPIMVHLVDGELYLIRTDMNEGFKSEWEIQQDKDEAKMHRNNLLKTVIPSAPSVDLTDEEIERQAKQQGKSAIR
jgi:hypothetical protein